MMRLLLKNWNLNSIAVFSLAIALALGVISLSISNAILLRPPVARDASQLAIIFTSRASAIAGGAPRYLGLSEGATGRSSTNLMPAFA